MTITKDRVISVDYTLRNKENECLDTTAYAEPFIYLHGHDHIIPGLERALEGKEPGDQLHITVAAAEAYGERNEELVMEVPLENFENPKEVEPGMRFEASTSTGVRVLTIAEVAGDTVTVDGNHPFAGLDLTFDITVKDVREASPEELANGLAHECSCEGGCEDCTDCTCS